MSSEMQQVTDALQLYHIISEKSNDPVSFERLTQFINASRCPRTKKAKKKISKQNNTDYIPQSNYKNPQQADSDILNANHVLQVLKYNTREKNIDFVDFYSYYQKIAMKAQLSNEHTLFSVLQHINGSGKILIQDLLKIINQVLNTKLTIKEIAELLQSVTGENNVNIVTIEMLMQVVSIFQKDQ